jgi:two-component system, NarL family, sensor histidine kinase DevS
MADVHARPWQVRRLLDAVVSISGDLDLPRVLSSIVQTAVDLVGASYGAIGVLDPNGTSLNEFVTCGIDEMTRTRIGHLPTRHGILGLLIADPKPLRLLDLGEHPARFGFPPGHPPMTSFLGTPVSVRGEVFGNLYLTDKRDGDVFTDEDEDLVLGLAAVAGVAIDNTRLDAQVRDVAELEERERTARDLHDTIIQRLFATGLSLQSAVRLAESPEVMDRISRAMDDLDVTVRQVRSVTFEPEAPEA